jgi:hypothetical protein
VLALRNAASSDAGESNAFGELLRVTPTVQIFDLLDDVALSGSRGLMQGESPGSQLEAGVPYLGAPAVDATK